MFTKLPEIKFIIAGTQKGGTSSLYNYITGHPKVVASKKKEIHYFDLNYDRGMNWYRKNFKMAFSKDRITGEASPYYMFHPLAMERIKKDLPGVKIIILLRNPVDRAFSHYNHEVRAKRENRSFEDAINLDFVDYDSEKFKFKSDELHYSENHHRFSYIRRGLYFNQVKKCFELFRRENILLLKSETLFDSPDVIYKNVIDFLNLSPHTLKNFPVFNSNSYRKLNEETRNFLTDFYKPHNEQLYELTGTDYEWK